MKKVLSLILVAALAISVFCIPAFASTGHVNDGDTPVFNGATENNAFGDLLDWTGVIFGDVNNSGIFDMKCSLAVDGNVTTSGGFTISQIPDDGTDDVTFLVNGNANINGWGSVTGQTVLGSAEGNDYRLSNKLASETTNRQYTVADSTQYFADAKTTAAAAKAAVDALPVNAICEEANGIYTFVGDADKDVLVYNVDDSVINSYRFDFNIAEGQTVVVNFTTSDKLDLSYGAFCINGSLDPDYLSGFNRNIIINIVNATEMEMAHCDMYGILLAPNTDLTGTYGDVCGTSILKSLDASNGFELHVGSNNSFIPAVKPATPDPVDPTTGDDPAAPEEGEKVGLRIDAPLKMAVAFEDGTVYYGGEMKEVVVGKEYPFQMCSVNWDNGIYDENGNGLAGTVVYRMVVVHRNEFLELAAAAKEDPERYTVKGIDIIDNVAKKIIVNIDASDTHLETDVNNFFMAYRFHFAHGDYNKKTGIENVINTPLESLSVNLPLGSTITCNAYAGSEMIDSADVFIENNSGEGIYENEYLTSVNDYTWDH